MDIARILHELDLSEYEANFREHRIDSKILKALTSDDLKEVGIAALGDRKRLLQFVNSLAQSVTQGEAAYGEQRRQVTVVFVDLVQSTELARILDPEDMRRLLRAFHAVAREAAGKFDGQILQFLGDGLYSCFGHPIAHEDDPERAVRFGLRLIDSVTHMNDSWQDLLGRPLELRVGIETGRVVVGGAESASDGQMVLLSGETPNLANHLQQCAAPGTIYLGPRTAALLPSYIEVIEVAPSDLRRAGNVSAAWKVTGLSETERYSSTYEASTSPFFGRDKELEILRRALADARRGQQKCVAISGEPGLGKSRLVHEFLSGLTSPTRVLWGSCARLDSRAFHVFGDLLESFSRNQADGKGTTLQVALEELGDAVQPHLSALLSIAGGDTLESKVSADSLGVGIREALATFCLLNGQLMPTVVFLNDIHWIDERSENAVAHLVQSSGLSGVLLILTHRPQFSANWLDSGKVERIVLPPLDPDAAHALFEARAGALEAVPIDVVDYTGGNPYFIEELAESLSQEGNASHEGQALPPSLNGLLQSRIDQSSAKAADLLRTAAVIGPRFEIDLAASPTDGREQALAELAALRLVRKSLQVPGTYVFDHALLHEAVYAGLARDDLIRLHTRIAHRIEDRFGVGASERSEELARHFEIAGDRLAAARYAYISGSKATGLFAVKDAQHWFDIALRQFPERLSPEDEALRKDLLSQQIYIHCWNAEFERMVELAESALSEFPTDGTNPKTAIFLSWLAEAYVHNGRLKEANSTLEAALRASESAENDNERALPLAQFAWLYSLTPPVGKQHKLATYIDSLKTEAQRPGSDPYFSLMVHNAGCASNLHAGNFGIARDIAVKMIEFGESRQYPPAICWGNCYLGYIEADAGNETDALNRCKLAAREAACAFDILAVDLCLGVVQQVLGKTDAALGTFAGVKRRVSEAGMFHFSHLSAAAEGRARLLAEDPGGAVFLVQQAQRFGDMGHVSAQATVAATLGETLLETGQPEQAQEWLVTAETLASSVGMVRLEALAKAGLAVIHLQSGRQDEARNGFDQAMSLAESLKWLPLQRKIRSMERSWRSVPLK